MWRERVRVTVTALIPSDGEQLSPLLGLIIFYNKFLLKRAVSLKPLYDAAKREKNIVST